MLSQQKGMLEKEAPKLLPLSLEDKTVCPPGGFRLLGGCIMFTTEKLYDKSQKSTGRHC